MEGGNVRYGYARVSSLGQQLNGNSLGEQTRQLTEAGAELVVQECFTGTVIDRPKLTPLLEKLQSGDTLLVTKLDRFARATDAAHVIEQLIDRGVTVNILNMGIANNSPTGTLMRNIILSFAKYERDSIWERTQEGKMAARQRPGYKEGRPYLEVPDFSKFLQKTKKGELTVTEACRELGISRSKWYQLKKDGGKHVS